MVKGFQFFKRVFELQIKWSLPNDGKNIQAYDYSRFCQICKINGGGASLCIILATSVSCQWGRLFPWRCSAGPQGPAGATLSLCGYGRDLREPVCFLLPDGRWKCRHTSTEKCSSNYSVCVMISISYFHSGVCVWAWPIPLRGGGQRSLRLSGLLIFPLLLSFAHKSLCFFNFFLKIKVI